MPCASLFHFKSHFDSTILLLAGSSETSTNVPAASSPSNSDLIASIQTSECFDVRAAVYDVGSGSASLTRQSGNFVFSHSASFAASSAWNTRPPSQGPIALISPAAASRLSALVCALVRPSRISSPSPGPDMCAPSWRAAVRTAVGVGASSSEADASLPS